MTKTAYISNWQTWKEICAEAGEDPWETDETGRDLGGGDSEEAEFVGERPEKEEEQ
jgi:hypothetical protein